MVPPEMLISRQIITVRQDVSNEEIARRLEISLRTTENYVSKIYDKLGVNGRSELVVK
ncbi:MAG: LuxR C-terminal-related transcriptional regulator [Spirochaetales bacterium]|nr:LuxR C-terminal-related transcriptional regulator [Spirochaetales bacterium]